MKSQPLPQGRLRTSVLFLSVFIFVSATSTGCDSDNGTPDPGGESNVLEVLQSNDDFETLSGQLEGTSLTSTLSGAAPVTIFAPTDAAFAALPQGYVNELTAQQKLELLSYHVFQGPLTFDNEQVGDTETYTSLNGGDLFILHTVSGPQINNSGLVANANIEASNGYIHAVNRVLTPDSFGSVLDNMKKRFNSQYGDLLEMIENYDLESELEGQGPLSFMAPYALSLPGLEEDLGLDLNDQQWAEILKYHIVKSDISGIARGKRMPLASTTGDSVFVTVIDDGGIMINYNTVMNIIGSANGKVYDIDGIMLPDKYVTVLTVMDKRFNLSTVRLAFATAKLTGTLYDTNGEFTVFVPRNNAQGVSGLPAGETELAEVLKYHVLPVKLTAAQLQNGGEYTTWQGQKITIAKSGNTVTINGSAQITLADLTGRNGVVHVIDRVLTVPNN